MQKALKFTRRSVLGLLLALWLMPFRRVRAEELIPALPSTGPRYPRNPQFFSGAGEPLSILQGFTDEKQSLMTVVVPAEESFVYQVETLNILEKVELEFEPLFGEFPATEIMEAQTSGIKVRQSRTSRKNSGWGIDRLHIQGLQLGRSYLLKVFDENKVLRDQRQFKALDLSNRKAKFAFGSCMNDQYDATGNYVQLSKDRPECFFVVGDSAYTDHLGFRRKAADPDQLWERHAETRNRIPFYFYKRLIPTLMTWDDHDFGLNNGNRTYAYKKEAAEILMQFFPQEAGLNSNFVRGPGVASLLKAFGQNFFLLDNRTFRSEEKARDASHWGAAQMKWLRQQATQSPRPTWIMSGSQFFGAYLDGEAVENEHPDSLEELRQILKSLPQVSVLASGDVHFSEFMKIEKEWLGYESFEITSSSMSSLYARGMDRLYSNPRRIASVAIHNYQFVETEVRSGALHLSVNTRGASDATYMSFKFVIQR